MRRERLRKLDGEVDAARADAALRDSEARFVALAGLVADLLWQSEPDGTMTWCNARWLEYTGQTLDEARGWGWVEAIHPDERTHFRASCERGPMQREPVAQEHRIRRHDGEYRRFLVRAEPMCDERGRVVRVIGAATEIHERRLALDATEWLAAQRAADRDTLRRQRAAAEEAERRRLARELHDSLGQHLTALALGLADMRRRLDAREPTDSRIQQLEELARVMTRDARTLALEIRPPELGDLGLESALATYVEQWSMRTGVEADVTVTALAADHAFATELATVLYRIVQEALTNVARYADASRVSVVLDRPDGEARLVIEDDGIGFDVEATLERVHQERRLGLTGMRERAALVGGTLNIESSLGVGTTIYVRVPRDDLTGRIERRTAVEVAMASAELRLRVAAAVDGSVLLRERRDAILQRMRDVLSEARRHARRSRRLADGGDLDG